MGGWAGSERDAVLQGAAGQLFGDGAHRVHPHGGLGLPQLPQTVPAATWHVLLRQGQGRDELHDVELARYNPEPLIQMTAWMSNWPCEP